MLAEEAVRFDHPLLAVANGVVVDGRLGAHDGIERRTIPVRRPDFEAVLGLRAKRLGIRDQRLDSHRRGQRPDRNQLCVQSVQEQLQGGQPLLTVDDGSLLHLPGLPLNLLQHHCAEKVRMVLVRWSVEDPVRQAHYVVPEWLPLVLLVPYVRTLEQRDDKPLWLHEHHLGRADLSLH